MKEMSSTSDSEWISGECSGRELTAEERERYKKTIALPGVGEAGQAALRDHAVLIVGAGGVGCPAALYLAAIGVGHLGIADGDTVALDNLHRQILYTTADIGHNKALAAAARLRQLNPDIVIEPCPQFLDEAGAAALAQQYDVVIDAVDSLERKLALARACERAGVAHIHGGIGGFMGQVLTCLPGNDTFSRLFDTADSRVFRPGGTFNATCGVVGMFAAAEATKYLLGIGDLLTDRVLVADMRTAQVDTLYL